MGKVQTGSKRELALFKAPVVRDLVDNGTSNLFLQRGVVVAARGESPAKEGDPIRKDERVRLALGEGDALVQSEQLLAIGQVRRGALLRRRDVRDEDRDVVEVAPQLRREPSRRPPNQPLETPPVVLVDFVLARKAWQIAISTISH